MLAGLIMLFTVIVVVIFVIQLYKPRYTISHRNRGFSAIVAVIITFILVMWRGLQQNAGHMPASTMLHLALGAGFFITFAFGAYYGYKIEVDRDYKRKHRLCMYWSSAFLVISLLFGFLVHL